MKYQCLNPLPKISAFIGKCHGSNKQRTKTCAAVQTLLYCFVSPLSGLLASPSAIKVSRDCVRLGVTVQLLSRCHIYIYIYIYIFKKLCMGDQRENQCYIYHIAPEMRLECYIAI